MPSASGMGWCCVFLCQEFAFLCAALIASFSEAVRGSVGRKNFRQSLSFAISRT